jgi:small subunit ribosomal protein S18
MPRRSGNSEKKGRKRSKKDEEIVPKKRSRHLDGVENIDANNYELLGKFVTDHGKVIPARLTGATAKQQRQIKKGVRRSRNVGLIP